MTQQEEIEGNKLIAEFMGSKYINEPFFDKAKQEYIDFWHWTKPENGWPIDQMGIELSTCFMIANFKFNYSWDWLMPVVEKIEQQHKYKVIIDLSTVRFVSLGEYNTTDFKYHQCSLTSKIDAVYMGIIAFIRYINSTPTT